MSWWPGGKKFFAIKCKESIFNVLMKPLAIVIPWFGRDSKGGAEQLAWQVATRLAEAGSKVEVLTTCCRSFLDDWSTNHYKPAEYVECNVRIRRFKVDRRNRAQFENANAELLSIPKQQLKKGISPVPPETAAAFVAENINSAALLKFIKDKKDDFQAFIFLPYLYGPILLGVPLVAEKSLLHPCLHNESYAYLPQVSRIFRLAKAIAFNSEGEAALSERLFGPGIISKSTIVGVGVETEPVDVAQLPQRVGSFVPVQSRFVLYLGRRDTSKNVDLLVAAYSRFKKKNPLSALQLVLAGPGQRSYSDERAGIFDLGLVSEKEKSALLAGCVALFQPSDNESYSRVIMEAWRNNRPVAAHRKCLATAMAVTSARGGWLAGEESEWADLFSKVDQITPEASEQLAQNGKAYAVDYADWDNVTMRYKKLIATLNRAPNKINKKPSLREIHQLLPDIAFGDAISNQAIEIKQYLERRGHRSAIYVIRDPDPELKGVAKNFRKGCLGPGSGVLYHHSIGSALTPHVLSHAGPKCLIYHNITPASFFEPYRPDFARLLEEGRKDLKTLAPNFPISAGDSAFNASELQKCGFQDPSVLPIIVNPEKWNHQPALDLMDRLQDGKTNLLFVGRIAPNKCQDDLIAAFQHYLNMDTGSRLILVGIGHPEDPYYAHVCSLVEENGLSDRVLLTGRVTDKELQAYYRTANLFWSMSEHEGFGVPLIEAMWFNVPVCAFKSSAVPETLGKAGIIFNTKDDLLRVAALAKLMVKDSELNAKIIKAQQQRRRDFLPENVTPRLEDIIRKMESAAR